MHVALIASSAWLEDELPTLRHLSVGLIDEQVRVVQVVPQRMSERGAGGFEQRVSWRESRFDRLNHERLVRLDESLEGLEVDLLHALDGRAWRAAVALGQRMSVPIVLGATGQCDLRAAEKLASKLNPQRTAIVATGEALASALRQRLGEDVLIQTVPLGVPPADTSPDARGDDAPLCAIVSGDGTFDSRYQAMLEAIDDVTEDHPDIQFFFDGLGSQQHEIWNAASRLDLLGHVSLVPRQMDRRDMLLRGDVFCQPQALGRSRSVALEAMAHAMPLLAAADPWADDLVHDETARLVREPTAEAWSAALRAVISDRSAARTLGGHARQWVREHRPVSRMVDATLYTYRQISGETIRFPDQ